MRLRFLAALLLAPALGSAAGAPALAAYRVTATVYPQGRITDTTQVRLVVSIDGPSMPEVATPTLPPLKNLRVITGPSMSRQSSTTFQNGTITSQNILTLTYLLLPRGVGPAEIPPFEIEVESTRYRTAALQFNVEAGGGPPPAPGPTGRSGRGTGPPPAGDDAGVDVFIETHLSATSAWVGQPVLLEGTLYTAANVSGFGWLEEPTLRDAWTDPLNVDATREQTRVERGGRLYTAVPVLRKVIVPTAAGTIAISSYTAQVQVERPARDRFGMLFGLDPLVNLLRKTAPLSLQVRALPAAGKPADFDGTVGSYRLSATCDHRQAQVGDAISVRATVEGLGSLQAARPPRFVAPPDAKVYEPKVVENVSTGANHLSSRKTWEWVVVPLAPGTAPLPELSLSYFDTESGSYREARADLPAVAVVRGASVPDTGIARGEVQPNVRDIAFVKTRRGPLREPAPPFQRRGWFVALLVLPLALVPLGIWAGRRRERLRNDQGFARGRRAARAAARRLARAAGRSSGAPALHEDVARALIDYVADRANRSAAGLTYDELDALLAGKGVPADLRRRYRVCLETCDFARFVPDAGRGAASADLPREAHAIVAALEEAW